MARAPRNRDGAEDEAAVLRAVAALEFVHASALVHDDVMDGAHTRRGRPATHVGFATRHAVEDLGGDGDLFGTGAAILVGDLALVWSDELLRTSRHLDGGADPGPLASGTPCAPRSPPGSTSTCCAPPAGCPVRTAH